MKIGIHTCCYTERFSDDPSTAFQELKDAGIELVEFSILDDYSLERARYLKQKLYVAGLEGACCTALPADADLCSVDSECRRRGAEYLKHCVDFSAELGAKTLSGVLYAPWGANDPSVPKEEKWARSVQVVREVCEYAARCGIVVCFEVLNRFESDVLNTLDEGAAYLSLVGADNLKLLADAFHMNIEERDIPGALARNICNIGNVHVSENDRNFPLSENDRWKSFLRTLREGGYDGSVTFECCTRCGTEVGTAFSQWRDLQGKEPIFETIKKSRDYLSKILAE